MQSRKIRFLFFVFFFLFIYILYLYARSVIWIISLGVNSAIHLNHRSFKIIEVVSLYLFGQLTMKNLIKN